MKNKYMIISCFIAIFIIISNSIYAEYVSGVETNILNISACYGNIELKLEPSKISNYNLISCNPSSMDSNLWYCPCNIGNQTNLYIFVPENETTQFNIAYQYYVGELKPVINYTEGIPTQEEVYNEQLKRVGNLQTPIFYNSIELKRIEEERRLKAQGMQTFIFTFIIYAFGGLLAITLFIVFIIVIKNNLRRWLKLKENEKLTLGGVMKKIFRRENINRVEIGKQSQTKMILEEPPVPLPPLSTEDEARKILEDL